jgi:hypothetical protein
MERISWTKKKTDEVLSRVGERERRTMLETMVWRKKNWIEILHFYLTLNIR